VRKVPLHTTDALGRTTLPQLRCRPLFTLVHSRHVHDALHRAGSGVRCRSVLSALRTRRLDIGGKSTRDTKTHVAKVQRAWEARFALASVFERRTPHAPTERKSTTPHLAHTSALSHAPTKGSVRFGFTALFPFFFFSSLFFPPLLLFIHSYSHYLGHRNEASLVRSRSHPICHRQRWPLRRSAMTIPLGLSYALTGCGGRGRGLNTALSVSTKRRAPSPAFVTPSAYSRHFVIDS